MAALANGRIDGRIDGKPLIMLVYRDTIARPTKSADRPIPTEQLDLSEPNPPEPCSGQIYLDISIDPILNMKMSDSIEGYGIRCPISDRFESAPS